MVKTAGRNSYTYQARWTGSKWVSSWTDEVDYGTADEIKIKEWQGLAEDPDQDVVALDVSDLESALEELKLEFDQLTKEEKA
jgi:hypothetical protein